MKTLKFEIVDPTGQVVEDKTQIIEFNAGSMNTLTISIGNYTYHFKSDGEQIAKINKTFIPYD